VDPKPKPPPKVEPGVVVANPSPPEGFGAPKRPPPPKVEPPPNAGVAAPNCVGAPVLAPPKGKGEPKAEAVWPKTPVLPVAPKLVEGVVAPNIRQ